MSNQSTYTITIPNLYEVGTDNKIESITITVNSLPLSDQVYITHQSDKKLEQRSKENTSIYLQNGWRSKEYLNQLINKDERKSNKK